MSDLLSAVGAIRIRAEVSLADPDTCTFLVSRMVHPDGPFFFGGKEEAVLRQGVIRKPVSPSVKTGNRRDGTVRIWHHAHPGHARPPFQPTRHSPLGSSHAYRARPRKPRSPPAARHSSPRPRLRLADRAFWLGLSRIWSSWANALVVVKPDTVVRWHRAGFRLFWRWKSRFRTPAKDEVSPEVKQLIRRMAEANVGWGAPRIHGELLKLGIVISERSVSRLMRKKTRKPPS